MASSTFFGLSIKWHLLISATILILCARVEPSMAIHLRQAGASGAKDDDRGHIFADDEIVQLSELSQDQVVLMDHEVDKQAKKDDQEGLDSFDDSFSNLLKQKKSLTTEVRQAGITQTDEEILDTFAETMTNTEGGEQNQVYEPKDDEIKKELSKVQQLNQEIFKEAHPDEFKKQQEDIKNKQIQDELLKNNTKDQVLLLSDEVQDTIQDFIQTAQDLKNQTMQRKIKLTKIKYEYKKLQKQRTHLKLAALKRAQDEALVQATEQYEKEEKEKQEKAFELAKVKAKAEAEARIKMEYEYKHKLELAKIQQEKEL